MAGELWLADGVGVECAAACEELILELNNRAEAFLKLSDRGGFGGFESARQLEAGFQRKAIEAHSRILEFRAVLERMQKTFLAADAAYRLRDEGTQQAIQRAGQEYRQPGEELGEPTKGFDP